MKGQQPQRLPVIPQFPPNFPAIVAVMPEAQQPGVIFAYGTRVYCPSGDGSPLPRELEAHEAVHLKRQQEYDGGPGAWWDKYLTDIEFRLAEEILAHRAEYAMFCKRHLCQIKRGEARRRIARKLAAPLYGKLISQDAAEIAILPLN